MTNNVKNALREMNSAFIHFSRNGRWGTCVDCPTRDSQGAKYPEFCKFTERYDHQLDVDLLASSWKRALL